MSGPDWHTANDHDLPPTDQTIRTISGLYVDLLDPDPATLLLDDIAHALSLINRFGGHTEQPYSVAEHSLGVCGMLLRSTGDARTALFGLIHDAGEAYLGDVVRPLKRHLQAYQDAEQSMDAAIAVALDLGCWHGDDERWAQVKEADTAILAFEMSTIRNASWRVAPEPRRIEAEFLTKFDDLYHAGAIT